MGCAWGWSARDDCQGVTVLSAVFGAEAFLFALPIARKSSLMKSGPSLLCLLAVVAIASGDSLAAQEASGDLPAEVTAASEVIGSNAEQAANPDPSAEVAQAAPSLLEQFFGNPLNLLLISGILFVMLVLRPQQKQAREMQAALAGLKKNDKVVTASGIHGTVVSAGSDEAVVTIRIDDNSGARMTVNRDAIAKILNSETKE